MHTAVYCDFNIICHYKLFIFAHYYFEKKYYFTETVEEHALFLLLSYETGNTCAAFNVTGNFIDFIDLISCTDSCRPAPRRALL